MHKRISNLSSSENIFRDTMPIYKQALRKSGYTSKETSYYNNNDKNKKRRRKINVRRKV